MRQPLIPVKAEASGAVDILQKAANLKTHSLDLVVRSRKLIEQSNDRIMRCRMLLEGKAPESGDALSSSSPAAPAVEPESPKPPKDLMELVSDRVFENTTVVLDGRHFVGCTITNCVLQYSGYPLVLESTSFEGCSFQFRDSAALTLNMLKCFQLVPGAPTRILGDSNAQWAPPLPN